MTKLFDLNTLLIFQIIPEKHYLHKSEILYLSKSVRKY